MGRADFSFRSFPITTPAQPMEEDYFAPLGMSSFDFNSMMRRRYLAHRMQQLVEQGRVTLPGTATVPSNTTLSVNAQHDAASTPEPPVADGEDVARPTSSVYSREIEDDSPYPSPPVNIPCSRRASSCEGQSPALMPLQSSPGSSRFSCYSGSLGIPSRSTSESTYNSSFCSGTAAPKARFDSFVCSLSDTESPQMYFRRPYSLFTDFDSIDERLRALHGASLHRDIYARADSPVFRTSEDFVLDLPTAIAALLQRYEQRHEPQELHPPIDRMLELGRLRRAIKTLDFESDDMIILASDLTSLVPVPPTQGSRERLERDDDEDDLSSQKFFRERLSRTVQRRITFLKLELTNGNARRVEHWYRDVVDLLGWRDEAESRLLWSWQERDGFF